VTGGIAAYKSLEFVRLATGAGHVVRVIQTAASTRFVGTVSFAAITGAPVLIDEWERDPARGAFPDQTPPVHDPLSHLQLVHNADVFLIAPLSANTLAKLATGQADNLLTAAALACRRPLVIAPAMNEAMYEHPATQQNVETLRRRGATVLEPGTGRLGSPGEYGLGRLPDPADLLAAIERVLAAGTAGPRSSATSDTAANAHSTNGNATPARDLDGLHVLVTAGGTREPIDSVRYIGNRSSGRMGVALAEEAQNRGARVTLIAANVALETRDEIERIDVETAAQLHDAALEQFPAADVLLMAAAIADYRPADPHHAKIKKTEAGGNLELRLERTDDVLSDLTSRRRPGQLLVGFAAEHGEGALDYGRDKLRRKDLDAVVVNDIARADIGFDSAENEVTILTHGEERHVAKAGKDLVARAILDMILILRSSSSARVSS